MTAEIPHYEVVIVGAGIYSRRNRSPIHLKYDDIRYRFQASSGSTFSTIMN